MKKLLCAAIALLFAAAMQAQEEEKDITKFLGIPVEGNKPAMIKKLKAKGFTRSIWDKDVLEGRCPIIRCDKQQKSLENSFER